MADKVIEIRDLHYSYPDKTKALSGIHLEIFKGEALGIIGPNGSGKSTLLLHLNGVLKGQGEIRVLGMEMTERSMPLIRSKVGLVFQDPENQLFMPTVFDDVSFGPINMDWKKDEVRGAVNHALNEVDMLKAAHRSSHHLSVGEKKRVAIATVLSMKPEILVLDEPSANLDPGHRRQLVTFLKELALTKIIATHDIELAATVCSRLALMDRGRIVVVGESDDILRDGDLLESHGM